MPHTTTFILVLFLFIVGLAADGYGGAILTYDGYVHLRSCAQLCIAGSVNADQPGIFIGCPSPVYDSCFCRGVEDLAGPVTSLISSCVNSRCSSDQTDVTAAFAVYNGYCSQAGYTHLATNNVATTTLNGGVVGAPTSTVLVITTETGSSGVNSAATLNVITTEASSIQAVVVTIHSTTTIPSAQGTGSGSSGGGGSGGLDQGNRIALGVGLGLGIPSLIVAIASCLGWGHRGRRGLGAHTGSVSS